METVRESGARMFRVVISNGFGEKSENKAQALNDDLFEFMAKHHITILPNVSGIPGFPANQLPDIGPGSKYLTRWVHSLEHLAGRYGPEGSFWTSHKSLDESYAPEFWEIWNEENYEINADANGGKIDPERYGRLLAVSHDALKEASPKAKILFGGLLTVFKNKRKPPERHMPVGQFIKKAGHSEDYAALSLHPYAFKGSVKTVTRRVKQNIQAARAALNHSGGKGKKIWITEIGWPVGGPSDATHPSVTESVQRERLNSVFRMIKERSGTAEQSFNIGNIFWYNIEDWVEGNPVGVRWDYHSGLAQEDPKLNIPGEEGKKRSAFEAFEKQAE
jgi:hypothetical protein